jgi:hypothetical protein
VLENEAARHLNGPCTARLVFKIGHHKKNASIEMVTTYSNLMIGKERLLEHPARNYERRADNSLLLEASLSASMRGLRYRLPS